MANPDLDLVRGIALLETRDADEGLPPLTRAATTSTDRACAWYFLGEAHRRLGHADEARAGYEQARDTMGRKRWKQRARAALVTETYRDATLERARVTRPSSDA